MSFEGFGVVLPGSPLTCEQASWALLQDSVGLSRRPGVLTRHVCDTDQIDMAATAVMGACDEAEVAFEDVDLLVCAQAVPFQNIPANAPLVLERLGVRDGRHEVLDINTTCLSFLNALDVVDLMVSTGRVRRAVIVSSEVASKGLPWDRDPMIAAHFGDAAVACVVSQGDTRIVSRRFETHASKAGTCRLESGGTRWCPEKHPQEFERGRFFQMDGKELFKTTFQHLPGFFDKVLSDAGWRKEDVSWLLPHQASPLAIAHVGRALGVSSNKIWNICAEVGNTISASLPLVLSRAVASGVMSRGDKVMMLGTSAGLGFGALAMEW